MPKRKTDIKIVPSCRERYPTEGSLREKYEEEKEL
jgi:hypothetical protein